jgi:hypothetical protein
MARAIASRRRFAARWLVLPIVILSLAMAITSMGSAQGSSGLGRATPGSAQGSLLPQVTATYSHTFTGSCNPSRTSVQFYANATGAVPPYNFSWNFGDGSPTVFLQNPSHSFASPALYDPVLTVTDADGYSNGTVLSVFVPAPPCAPPVAGTGQQPWVLDGVVAGFVVGACGLVFVASRRWRE